MADYNSPDGIYEPIDFEELDLKNQRLEDEAMEEED